MSGSSDLRLQFVVFTLVSASFTNIYITQPDLPILQSEFATDMVWVSLSVSAVVLGIALFNLPFGALADRFAIQPLIAVGGLMVATGGLICAATHTFWILIAARFLQGMFVPALTTCLAAYLAKTLPPARLNVVMGSYVSASVLGGLSGRLIGGWLHPPLHWRYAFVTAAGLIVVATLVALWKLPRKSLEVRSKAPQTGFMMLLRRGELWWIYGCGAGSFAIFSSIFNFLPYRLTGAPFHFSTEMTTVVYLVYAVGIGLGPLVGKLSNHLGSGVTLLLGTLSLGAALPFVLIPRVPAVVAGLLLLCAGFFTIHAAAVGSLNRKLSGGQGRANALYVLFYYLGGWFGITSSGFVFRQWGWQGVIGCCALLLLIPLVAGLGELRNHASAR